MSDHFGESKSFCHACAAMSPRNDSDFCDISRGTLHAEIAELTKQVGDGAAPRQVSEESIAAIDAVRQVGNIGAHFESDINLIIEVEPEEATALIGLVELLFQEWYVARWQRQERLAQVKALAAAKKASQHANAERKDEGRAAPADSAP